MKAYIDIPTYNINDLDEMEAGFKNIEMFTGPNAIVKAVEFCRDLFGADDEGRVKLISIDIEEEDL